MAVFMTHTPPGTLFQQWRLKQRACSRLSTDLLLYGSFPEVGTRL